MLAIRRLNYTNRLITSLNKQLISNNTKPSIARNHTTMSATNHSNPSLDTIRIILGSASSSRRQLMDELAAAQSFSYDVVTADIDEKAIRDSDPHTLVTKLAHAKAQAIIQKLQQTPASSTANDNQNTKTLLITCDQVVVHENNILEKPHDKEEAYTFIQGYGRAPAFTIGSVLCTDLSTGHSVGHVDVAEIHFTDIPRDVADALIEEGEVMWCAGGLMVEHPLVQPYLTKLDGGIDSVMGLKKDTVWRLMNECLDGTSAALK